VEVAVRVDVDVEVVIGVGVWLEICVDEIVGVLVGTKVDVAV
jgi:hypothetical protein